MVEMVGLGGGLIMLWRTDLDVTLVNFFEVHIDVWIENWLPRAGCFLTRFLWSLEPRVQTTLLESFEILSLLSYLQKLLLLKT